MIKKLRYLCTLLLLAVVSGAWAETKSITFSELGLENGVQYTAPFTNGDVSVTFAGGANDGKYYTTGSGIRTYGNGTITIAANGKTITSIALTFSGTDYAPASGDVWTCDGTGTGTYGVDASWEGSATEVVLTRPTGSGHWRLQKVEVTFGNPTCATPTFSPGEGTFTSAQSVSISCTTSGATIYYTIDGNDPTTSSSVYSSPIAVSTTTTIKAIAVKSGMDNSEVATATYMIVNIEHAGTESDPYTVADARNAIDVGEGLADVYATGIVSAIPTAYDSSYKNITFNFVDNEGDANFLQAYRCTGDDAADVTVGDVVVVKGTLTKFGSTYEFAQGCTLVSLTHPVGSVEKPTFTPDAGTYTEAQNVTIACATDGANIFYTTDGTEPTSESTEYTSAIAVNTTTTIKAVAIKGEAQSAVATATYHINSQASPYTVAQALAFNEYPANGIYVHGVVSTAPTQAPTETGQLTYYISDNGEATDQLQVYKGKGLEQAAFTAQDDIQVGDIVTIYGNVKIYNNTKEFDTNNYLVSFERPDAPYVLPVPTFDPAAGEVEAGTTVKIVVPEDENVDYVEYSIDGETWTEYDTENTVITITEETTVYARSVGTENESYSEVVSATYTIKGIDYAVLPFEWKGGVKADLEALTGVTTSGLGTDYGESHGLYRVKLDNTDDYIQVKTDSQPGKVTIGVKMIGGANTSTITVQESSEGEEFTDVQELTISGAQNDILSLETTTAFDASSRYVRLYFTKGSNIGVGPITISKPATEIVVNETLDLAADATSGEIAYSIVYPQDGVALNATTDAEWISDVTVSADKVTFTTTANTGAERSGNMTLTYGTLTKVVTVTQAAAPQEYTITIDNPENVTITVNYGEEVLQNGESATLENGTEMTLALSIAEGYALETLTVAGEGEDQTVTLTEDPTVAGVYTFTMPSYNITVTATVVKLETTTYTLATSITPGKHYIIVGTTDSKAQAMGEQKSNNRAAVDVTIADGTATVLSTAGVYEFMIGGNATDGYTIYDENEKSTGYLYAASSSSNHLKTQATNDDNGLWTITFGDGGVASIVAKGTNTRNVMQYNSGSSLFACYASASQSPVYLYEKDGEVVIPAPTFSSAAGTYDANKTVVITAADGATIYYTTDGSTPTTESTQYTKAITINETTTIKAIAVKDGLTSVVAEATYTIPSPDDKGQINNPYTVADISELANGLDGELTYTVYVKGIIAKMGDNTGVNACTFFVSDDGSDASTFKIDRSTYLNHERFEDTNRLFVGDEMLVAIDRLYNYPTDGIGNHGTYIYGRKASVPTYSVAGGEYTAEQSVEITCANEAATIYYTLDGTEPTKESTAYTGAITIGEGTTTLKAVAWLPEVIKNTIVDVAESYSEVASATYTIAVSTQKGDVNGDTKVDVADVTALVNLIVNNTEPTAEQLAAGDFDNSGTLTATDVEALVQLILSNQ
ncbi:MAG: chitobiase/beta-hexosaminidase C-terminal domain-containing protein [Prevotella sp.]|nr:chitobiase/beta-hexosaminidase C-terminal domain-containing protein [Prevotella sp.]